MRRLLLAMIAFLLLAGPIAACGKLGPPEVAPGVKNTYPRTYPSGAS